MPRRWWVVSAVIVFLAGVLGWNLYLAAARPTWRINRERFEQIKEGMTRDEVIALIGLPPGDYTFMKAEWINLAVMCSKWPPWLTQEDWAGDAGCIILTFEGGKVVDRQFIDPSDWHDRDWQGVLLRMFAPDW
jgi:hypothetical protein